jgi:hypothetical protein
MAKSVKAFTILADREKIVWAEGQFTQALTSRLLKIYKRFGVDLTAYGSLNQIGNIK